MQIDYVFPHPIARLDISDEVNNDSIVKSVVELSETIDENSATEYWDCKLITSFENEKIKSGTSRIKWDDHLVFLHERHDVNF